MKDLVAGVGHSEMEGSFAAGQAAAREAIAPHSVSPQVLIVFGAPRFDHKELLKGITSVTGDVPMVGGTTAGEISNIGFSGNSVVIMALNASSLRFYSALSQNMSQDEYACGASLAQDIVKEAPPGEYMSMIIFPDGMGGDGVRVIEGVQSVMGEDFEIVGGCLGDGQDFRQTFQYYNGRVYQDAITGLLVVVTKEFKTGVGVRSGFESIGNRFYCTESEGNVIHKFDEKRALDFYVELLGEERSKKLPEIALEYPFGMIDEKAKIMGKEYFQLRSPVFVDHENGTITLAGSIPKHWAVTLTAASRADIIRGAKLAAEQAKACIEGAKPQVIFMFSCVGRKLVLGRRTREEVDAVKNVLGRDVPLLGFYTYGEIGSIDKLQEELKPSKFHNETVALWVLGNE